MVYAHILIICAPRVINYTPIIINYAPRVVIYTPIVINYTPLIIIYAPRVINYTPVFINYAPREHYSTGVTHCGCHMFTVQVSGLTRKYQAWAKMFYDSLPM
jgi:hypothetical protein